MRTLVVEDEVEARTWLVRLLDELGVSVAGQATSGEEALRIVARQRVDAAFLDIRLPEMDGLRLGRQLRSHSIPIVFVTGFVDYAVPAFDVEAVDYLVKPVTPDRLARTLLRLRADPGRTMLAPLDRLCVRERSDRLFLPLRTLLYARRDGNTTTLTGQEESRRIREPLDSLEPLLVPQGFFRSHRAFLVNLRHVRRIVPWSRDAQSLLLDDPKETLIPLAKSRVKALQSLILWV